MRNLLVVILLFVVSACSDQPVAVAPITENNPLRNNRVFIANHGWHTGLILPARQTTKQLPFLTHRLGTPSYYEFGWGDKGFYQAGEITVGLAIPALLWPTRSVMHVVAVPNDPGRYFYTSDVVEIRLSSQELDSVIAFVGRSFDRSASGRTTALGNGLYGDSQFYKGKGHYFLGHTCNTWTANGLRSAGMDIFPWSKVTANSIISYLRESGRAP